MAEKIGQVGRLLRMPFSGVIIGKYFFIVLNYVLKPNQTKKWSKKNVNNLSFDCELLMENVASANQYFTLKVIEK